MANIVHLVSLEMKNFKNVKDGKFNFPKISNYEKNNVLGIYGQNASGKTAAIKAITLLRSIIALKNLPDKVNDVVTLGADFSKLKIELLLKLDTKIYNANYEVKISLGISGLFISKEHVTYKRNLALEKEAGFESDILRVPTLSLNCDLENENELFNYKSSTVKSANFDISSLTEKNASTITNSC